MPRISVNFSEVGEYELVPEGHHPFIVSVVDVRQSEEGKYPYLNWDLEITDGPAVGRHLFMRTSLSPKALFRLLPVLEALDVIDESFDLEVDDLDIDFDEETGIVLEPDLEGLVGVAVVFHETFEGRTTSNVSEVLHIDTYDLQGAPVSGKKSSPEPESEEKPKKSRSGRSGQNRVRIR